jgi:hypothetical protein
MKTQVVIALIGASSAVSLKDAPIAFNEPSWRQSWPSASGLVQIDDQFIDTPKEDTICNLNAQKGVTCQPSNLFANGMVGNEDLKKEIDMKGVTYNYSQDNKDHLGEDEEEAPSSGCGCGGLC